MTNYHYGGGAAVGGGNDGSQKKTQLNKLGGLAERHHTQRWPPEDHNDVVATVAIINNINNNNLMFRRRRLQRNVRAAPAPVAACVEGEERSVALPEALDDQQHFITVVPFVTKIGLKGSGALHEREKKGDHLAGPAAAMECASRLVMGGRIDRLVGMNGGASA